ncbi:hypothetical protein BRPE64_ECDS02670 (plasmid) [Caballeronia insecticola]|uniref:Uncharacterized protein n=1 Tax=Caballeronia insecticola TaxID=758793 RepID=A0A060PR62_9BURK|nr:hypothetical protein BRPE64_ECDS02670 [Caballeronia insecticola]
MQRLVVFVHAQSSVAHRHASLMLGRRPSSGGRAAKAGALRIQWTDITHAQSAAFQRARLRESQ